MKYFFVFTLIGLIHVHANVLGQQISLSLQNATVRQALKEIENQCDLVFMYDFTKINMNKTITIVVENESVENVLKQITKETDSRYEIIDKQIVLIPQQKQSTFAEFAEIMQGILITGKVTDAHGDPLPGVTISIRGVTQGTTTDANGTYSIQVPNENSTLAFSYVGFIPQEKTIGGQRSINIVLLEDIRQIDEVVVVGYGVQKKSTLTGSIASIKADQLAVTPIGNITNAFTGKLPGLITTQLSGMPGSDQAKLNIRGYGDPLVIVDGIEAKLTNLDPNQVESVSILKDGASSIYGARAGNGVILITTKRGISQKPTISVETSCTMQGVTHLAKTLSSGQWTQLARETHLNSGKPESTAPYTADQVSKYYAGNDPAYPSSDWYNFVFRDWAPQQNHNLSIRGGSDKVRYMGYFGYQKQETMVKKGGGDYQRYNMLFNFDASITKNLTLTLDLMATYENGLFAARFIHQQVNKSAGLWGDLYSTLPMYPTTLPDPTKYSFAGITIGSIALSTNKDIWGYTNSKPKDLRGTIALTYAVPFVEGLKAKAFVNYLDMQTFSKVYMKSFDYYTYNYAADLYIPAGRYINRDPSTEKFDASRRITQQYSLNYDRIFMNAHHVTALALFESVDYAANNFWASRSQFLTENIDQLFAGSTGTQLNNGSASELGRASFIGRLNYSFKDKYLLETILRADASSKFMKGKRWGYFPSVSLGWVLSQEGFLRDLEKVDLLKLRASYGSSGYDNVGDFKYLSGYRIDGFYHWGNDVVSGMTTTGIANTALTWEVMKVYNGGLDFSIQDRTVYGSIEAFYRTRTGIPGTRILSVPTTFGSGLPQVNINSQNNRGFELTLGTAKNKGGFYYDINANISWSRAKWDHYDEPEFEDPDQKRQTQKSGQWTDRVFGYVSDGLFTSTDEINALPYKYTILGGGNASLRPGDVKFKDVNGDGELNWKDQQEVGKGTLPHWFYGLTGTFAYKGFDLVALFQGAFGYNFSYSPMFSNKSTYFDLRWTEAKNDAHALIPRPGGAATNGVTSDYFFQSCSYMRLKNFALGYTLPKQWVEKAGIGKLRLYVSGSNLFTLSTFNKFYIDPEAPNGIYDTSSPEYNPDRVADNYYPQQRTISFGLNIDF